MPVEPIVGKKDLQVIIELCFSKDAPGDRNVAFVIVDGDKNPIHKANDFTGATAEKLEEANYSLCVMVKLIQEEIDRRRELGESVARTPLRSRFDLAKRRAEGQNG